MTRPTCPGASPRPTPRGFTLHISTVNAAPATSLARDLAACADIPRWVDALVSGRPYSDAAHLLAEASELTWHWSPEDVLRAVSRHPRIGERAAGAGAEAAMSAREQSGVATDKATRVRLEQGNAAYEKRFGHVFLIRAAGRSEDDVLAALELRLGNDPETEIAVVSDELRQIALLRLGAMVDP